MFKKIFRKLFYKKTQTDFPDGFIPNKFFLEKINKDPILVIGDYNGRDFLSLNKKFKEVYLLDVSDNNLTKGKYFINQSITEKTPFPDNFFNYVVMANVIEHVWEDKKSLEEIRRILSSKGKLLFCVPFYADDHDKHYHIYSPKTINILFNHSGLNILEKQYMGTMTSMSNNLLAIIYLVFYPFFKQKSPEIINNFLYKIHKYLSKSIFINKFINFKNFFSVLIFAEKSKNKIDPLEVQRKGYQYNKNK